ncbi:MAG: PilZ domain-containing protein [Candidatus Eremiobacterota bacterium]
MLEGFLESLKGLLAGAAGSNPSLEEKRGAYRIPCHVNVNCRFADSSAGGAFTALCTDLGTTGMRIEASARERLKKGSILIVNQVTKGNAPALPPVKAEVVWTKRIGETGRVYVGMRFHGSPESLKSTWVGPTLEKMGYAAKAKAAERRRHVRLGSGLPAVVYGRDGSQLSDGKLVDLSGGGAKIEIVNSIISGVDVKIKIGPGERIGTIEIPASVVQCREDRDKPGFVLRVKFVQLEPANHKALKKYLTTLQRQIASI